MSDRQKTIELEEGSTCFNTGSLPHYDLKSEIHQERVQAEKKARILAPGEMVTMKIPADYRERCPEAASLRVEVEVPQ